jgi:5-methyltetrahydropteroyltriglutamate--homocysteine methyltransferase
MRGSETRIRTTHAGSLPRPAALTAMYVAASRGEPVDAVALASAVSDARAAVVGQQVDAGLDVINDGEAGRESFFTYVRDRMTGFGDRSHRAVMSDITAFESYLEIRRRSVGGDMVNLMSAPAAIGPVVYGTPDAVDAEADALVALLAAVAGGTDGPDVEGFLTAPSPGIVAAAMENRHYASLDEYVAALATALRVEYEAIARRGLVLQIDAPDLALERHTLFAGRPLDDFLAFVDLVIGQLNDALANVPRAQVRLHVCWGNYDGPHHHDVPLEAILPHLLEARVGALVLSMANPRHAHEHRVLAREGLPAGTLLVAGVIDTTTNYVEHPEAVAERIERAAAAVGDAHRVIAGTDCGFDTAAGRNLVASEVAWEKLRSLTAGAALASSRLF